MSRFKMDFHTHSNFSADSKTPMEQMVQEAVRRGITHLAFTEHVDYDNDLALDIKQWDFNQEQYFEQMKAMKQRFGNQINLYSGVELGVQPHLIAKNTNLIKHWSFDFVIASLHTVEGYDLYYKNFFDQYSPNESVYQYFLAYYQSVLDFDAYDVLGHLDLYLRYMPDLISVPRVQYLDVLDTLLTHIIEKGKGIELNAGGFRYGLANNNPADWILKRYNELGGEIITLGSDAHSPEYLGYAYNENIERLKLAGFKYVTYYNERKPQFIKL